MLPNRMRNIHTLGRFTKHFWQQYSEIGNAREQLFHARRSFRFEIYMAIDLKHTR